MFGKKKPTNTIDPQQQALFEHAQERIKEKKSLYNHLVFYLVGCLFMVLLNLVFKIGLDWKLFNLDWYVYGILIWTFFFLVHAVKVMLLTKFMGKAWQAEQLELLVSKQKEKIAKMEEKLDLQIPKEVVSEKNILLDKTNETETTTNEDPEILQ